MNKERDLDLQQWKIYKSTRSPQERDALYERMKPVVMKQVNKWAGPIPKDVLVNNAKALTYKAFDTYNPNMGTALSTHVTNSLAPLSRIVYTHQNTARLPENLTLKVHSYNSAKDHLASVQGYEPTTDQLHQELGWGKKELDRLETYMRRDLVESEGGLNDSFYDNQDDSDMDILDAIYMDLMPDEKRLFEYTTGYNNKPKLSNTEIMKKLNMNQAQLSYKKKLLTDKIQRFMRGRR
jgi:DNA-directed RNA polymerase specialized sigma subunit